MPPHNLKLWKETVSAKFKKKTNELKQEIKPKQKKQY